MLEFQIPVDQCGTNTMDIESENGEPAKRGFENIVVFQNDPIYQEQWDHARMMVCRYSMDDDFDSKDKRVIFKPIVIDMLDVVSIPIEDEDGQQSRVDCWMEISKGRFPHTTDIEGAVKVGSPLTLAIFVKDPRKRTDIHVKDCYAYDDPKIAESNGPALLQLTDFDGCPNRPKLIEVWKRTQDTGDTGATIIAFTTVTAFKFPDRPDLQLTCNIELCREKCASRCSSEMPDPVSVGAWTKTVVDDGSVPTSETNNAKDEEKEKTESVDGENIEETSADSGYEEEKTDSEEKNEDMEETEGSDKEEGGEEAAADEGETSANGDEEEGSKMMGSEEESDKPTEDDGETAEDEEKTKAAADEERTEELNGDEEEAAEENSGKSEEAADTGNNEEEAESGKMEEAADGEEEVDEEKQAEEAAADDNKSEQEKEPTGIAGSEDGVSESSENKDEEEVTPADAEEDEEEKQKAKRAKLKIFIKKSSKAKTRITTTTAAPIVKSKLKKTSSKPKAEASKIIAKSQTSTQSKKSSRVEPINKSENGVDEIRATIVTTTKIQRKPSKKMKKTTESLTNIRAVIPPPLANHMSTTTLRPLKEHMDSSVSQKLRSSNSSFKSSKSKTLKKLATTTTTTTTTPVKPAKKSPKKPVKSKSLNLKRHTRHPSSDELHRNLHEENPQPGSVLNNNNNNQSDSVFSASALTDQPMRSRSSSPISSEEQRRRSYYHDIDESPYEIDAMRSFYAYSNFQPQRIRRSKRTTRSVNLVKWSQQKGSILSLGARVISGLEITM